MVERVEDDEPVGVPSVDKMIYTSWQVYPIRTQISSVQKIPRCGKRMRMSWQDENVIPALEHLKGRYEHRWSETGTAA